MRYEHIVRPIDRRLLLDDLQRASFVHYSRHCDAEVYTFDGMECPSLMREVGRLREESFRAIGAGCGKSVDIEKEDIDGSYRQMVVWDAETMSIIGGYRYAVGGLVPHDRLAMWRYFNFSDDFCRNYLPHAVELGRSFIQPRYQQRRNRHSLFAQDMLWEGMGAVIMSLGNIRYLLGKVTLYPSLGIRARNLLLGFLYHGYASREGLVTARIPFVGGITAQHYKRLFVGSSPRENYRILLARMRSMRRSIPPMISSYMRLSPSMRVFDTCLNNDFGGVAETGIMLAIDEFYDDMRMRYFKHSV